MTEPNTMAETPTEGNIAIPGVEGDNTSTDSPAETKETDKTPPAEGDNDDNTQQDSDGSGEDTDGDDTDDGDDDGGDGNGPDNVPFHEHPRWKQREEEWDNRFNEQEQRHQDDMKQLREELTGNKADDLSNEEPPSWFGGTKEQWAQFQDWNKEQVKSVQKGETTAQQKAVADATTYFKSELSSIEGDKTLNPDGKKIDPNALLKTVIDNDLVDSKGRWNYRAGWRLLRQQSGGPAPKPKTNTAEKKKIAGATTSEPSGEAKPKTFKTTDDFKRNPPW